MLSKKFFDKMGLYLRLRKYEVVEQFNIRNRRGTKSYARWCERQRGDPATGIDFNQEIGGTNTVTPAVVAHRPDRLHQHLSK